MFHEAGLPVPKDLLHNEWINYYKHTESLIKDTTPVYVSSRRYFFLNMKAKVSCNIHHNTKIPECTMTIDGPHETVTENVLSICHTICQHQAVSNLDMWAVQCKDLQKPHVFTISKKTESLEINYCMLPKQTMRHVIQQINGCGVLKILHLSGTDLRGCLSSFLPDPHPGLPQLENLENLWATQMNKDDLVHLFAIPGLKKLHLTG